MKGIVNIFILSGMFALLSPALAAGDEAASPPPANTTSSQPANMNSSMWTCTTNASSASSGSTDDQADKQMAKNVSDGTTAFDFALKNCRDCTKITCEQQTKPAQ